MRKTAKIKLLNFILKSEGAFFLIPPMPLFIAGASLPVTIASAIAGILLSALCRALKNKFAETLRKLNRSPLQEFIEDSGLPESEAREAWNEVTNI
jgi:hypothetical protein